MQVYLQGVIHHQNLGGTQRKMSAGCFSSDVFWPHYIVFSICYFWFFELNWPWRRSKNNLEGCKITINTQRTHRILVSTWYFAYCLSNIIVMMLMMTMNLYVCLALAIGLTLGFLGTELYGEHKRVKVSKSNQQP